MGVVEDGPVIPERDWADVERVILAAIIANFLTGGSGASVQQSGSFGETAALVDQVAGKVGPMIGKWDPEKDSRMIQEF